MQIKRVFLRLFILIIGFILLLNVIPFKVFASSENVNEGGEVTLKLSKYRGIDSDGFDPSYAFPGQLIYKINLIDGSTTNSDKAVYCLDMGRGFGSGRGLNLDSNVTYNEKINMSKTLNKVSINKKELANNSSTSWQAEDYDKIVTILGNIYVPDTSLSVSDRTSAKNEFLRKILGTDKKLNNGVNKDPVDIDGGIDGLDSYHDDDYYYITEKDIEVAQQLALWHYTNENTTWGDDTILKNILKDVEITALYERFEGDNQSYLDNTDPSTIDSEQYSNLIKVQEKYDKFNENTGDYTGEDKHIGLWNKFKGIENIYKYFLEIAEDSTKAKTNNNGSIYYWTVSGANDSTQPVAIVEPQPADKKFDLALRKFITKIDGTEITDREPVITQDSLENLSNGAAEYDNGTTIKKTHPKDKLKVSIGSIVKYKIRIYNEGEIDGTAKEVVDYLPEGLDLALNSEINRKYGWTADSTNPKRIITKYLTNREISAFSKEQNSSGQYEISYEDLEIECIVNESANSNNLKNIAEITDDTGDDIDSTPNNVNKDNYNPTNPSTGHGEQDDDDFEDLYIESKFDLSLRKFITAINDKEREDRIPVPYTTDLDKDASGYDENTSTAKYVHPKNPIGVSKGDIVTYTIRVYNEGAIDGYANEITDYLPEQLSFPTDEYKADKFTTQDEIDAAIEFNAKYGWTQTTNNNKQQISTDILSENTDKSALKLELCTEQNRTDTLLKAYDNKGTLNYIDLKVKCIVNGKATTSDVITNIAEITDEVDVNGNKIDRDSKTANFPDEKKNNDYEGRETVDGYTKGQQDDDDFEKLIIQQFDLSLRKFISDIDGKATEGREPQVDTTPLKQNTDTTAIYNHSKIPITVVKGSLITYTIRVYNEGNLDGYVEEITDYLPEELQFIEDSEINKQYNWKISKDGRIATTDYLKFAIGETTNLLKAYDGGDKLDYRDVKIQFRLKDTTEYQKNITNLAQITEDSNENGKEIDDRDSTPDGGFELPKDEDLPSYKEDESSKLYVPGQEDDDDFEKINVVYFDLALRKIVSKAIVIENGTQTVTETNHKFEDDPEAIVKVDLGRKDLNKVKVQFEYQIRITNEGLIAGYCKEIKDYIPEGLMFYGEDNPLWKVESDGIITTDQIADVLLQPGDSRVVSVLLTWINSGTNLGLKTNIAEISKDDNEYKEPDIDSTPNNKKYGEDDIDDAPVMLSIALGEKAKIFVGITLLILTSTGLGIFLIRKFVL